MLAFFNTKERLRFLLFVAAIAVPILIAAIWIVSSMETSSAAAGEPNDIGGLHYRIEENGGASVLPPALAALVSVPANTAMTDVSADTDSTGRLTSAAITAFSTDDFSTVAAFHRPTLTAVTTDDADALEGVRDGYEIRISRETSVYDDDPYKDRTKIEYYIDPEKTSP